MKFTAAALIALFAGVHAGQPQLSLSVRDGSFSGIEGLDPTLSWESSTEAGDLDISYGASAHARATTDLASLPKSIWGKVQTDVSGWGVSARAATDGLKFDSADLEVDADNEDVDLSVHMVASAGRNFNVRSIEATKGLDANGARVTVTPRLNLEDDTRDVVVNYAKDKTAVKLTASADSQEVYFSQQIDDKNRIAPSITSGGDLSVEWERRINDDSSLTATLKPNDRLDVEWRDAAWTANIRMPIDGTNINGADVSIKRDVNF